MSNKLKSFTLKDTLPYIFTFGGLIGILSAAILMLDKISLLQNPHQALNCDLNPIIACGSVINTPQASAFGFSNTIIGLIGFAAVLTVGMALLAGAKFRRWFWLGLEIGTLFGIGFVTWLQFETIFRIGALCPYCMVVWAVTIPIFLYTTLFNLREGYLKTPIRFKGLVRFLQRHHGDVLTLWYIIIIAIILNHFWYYWSTLI